MSNISYTDFTSSHEDRQIEELARHLTFNLEDFLNKIATEAFYSGLRQGKEEGLEEGAASVKGDD